MYTVYIVWINSCGLACSMTLSLDRLDWTVKRQVWKQNGTFLSKALADTSTGRHIGEYIVI